MRFGAEKLDRRAHGGELCAGRCSRLPGPYGVAKRFGRPHHGGAPVARVRGGVTAPARHGEREGKLEREGELHFAGGFHGA